MSSETLARSNRQTLWGLGTLLGLLAYLGLSWHECAEKRTQRKLEDKAFLEWAEKTICGIRTAS